MQLQACAAARQHCNLSVGLLMGAARAATIFVVGEDGQTDRRNPRPFFLALSRNNVNLKTVQNTYTTSTFLWSTRTRNFSYIPPSASERLSLVHIKQVIHFATVVGVSLRRHRYIQVQPSSAQGVLAIDDQMRIYQRPSRAWSANCSLAASRTPAAVVSSRPLMERSTSR